MPENASQNESSLSTWALGREIVLSRVINAPRETGANDQPSIILVEFLGFGGGAGDADPPEDKGRRGGERTQNPDSPVQVVGAGYLDRDAINQLTSQERKRLVQ